jgi:hypothetical protein
MQRERRQEDKDHCRACHPLSASEGILDLVDCVLWFIKGWRGDENSQKLVEANTDGEKTESLFLAPGDGEIFYSIIICTHSGYVRRSQWTGFEFRM